MFKQLQINILLGIISFISIGFACYFLFIKKKPYTCTDNNCKSPSTCIDNVCIKCKCDSNSKCGDCNGTCQGSCESGKICNNGNCECASCKCGDTCYPTNVCYDSKICYTMDNTKRPNTNWGCASKEAPTNNDESVSSDDLSKIQKYCANNSKCIGYYSNLGNWYIATDTEPSNCTEKNKEVYPDFYYKKEVT